MAATSGSNRPSSLTIDDQHLPGSNGSVSRPKLVSASDESKYSLHALHSTLMCGEEFLKHSKSKRPKYKRVWCTPQGILCWSDVHDESQDMRKQPATSTMRMKDISTVVRGKKTASFVKGKSGVSAPEHLCFSIVSKRKTLDLQAPSQNMRDLWAEGILSAVIFVKKGLKLDDDLVRDDGDAQLEEEVVQLHERDVAKADAAQVSKITEEEMSLLTFLDKGEVVTKYTTKGKTRERVLNIAKGRINWRTVGASASNARFMPLIDVHQVIAGKETEVFLRKAAKQVSAICCFSVVGRERTLDIQASTKMSRDRWVQGIRYAAEKARQLEDEKDAMRPSNRGRGSRPAAATVRRSMSGVLGGLSDDDDDSGFEQTSSTRFGTPQTRVLRRSFTWGDTESLVPSTAPQASRRNSIGTVPPGPPKTTPHATINGAPGSDGTLRRLPGRVKTQELTLTHIRLLGFLDRGQPLKKYGRSGKPKEKWVNIYKGNLFWGPPLFGRSDAHNLSDSSVMLLNIKGVLKGKITDVFSRRIARHEQPENCFSVVLESRTLDFVCKSSEERDRWVIALKFAVRRNKAEVHRQVLETARASANERVSLDDLPKSQLERKTRTPTVGRSPTGTGTGTGTRASSYSTRTWSNRDHEALSSANFVLGWISGNPASPPRGDDDQDDENAESHADHIEKDAMALFLPRGSGAKNKKKKRSSLMSAFDGLEMKSDGRLAAIAARQKAADHKRELSEKKRDRAEQQAVAALSPTSSAIRKRLNMSASESPSSASNQQNANSGTVGEIGVAVDGASGEADHAINSKQDQLDVKHDNDDPNSTAYGPVDPDELESYPVALSARSNSTPELVPGSPPDSRGMAESESDGSLPPPALLGATPEPTGADVGVSAVNTTQTDADHDVDVDAGDADVEADSSDQQANPGHNRGDETTDDGDNDDDEDYDEELELAEAEAEAEAQAMLELARQKEREREREREQQRTRSRRESMEKAKNELRAAAMFSAVGGPSDEPTGDSDTEEEVFDDVVEEEEEEEEEDDYIDEEDEYTEVEDGARVGDLSVVEEETEIEHTEVESDAPGYSRADEKHVRGRPLSRAEGQHVLQIVRRHVEKLQTADDNWSERTESMQALETLIREKPVATIGPKWWREMDSLRRCMVVQLEDLRSSVVKAACRLLIALASALGEHELFADFVSFLLPVMFDRLYVTIKVISQSVDKCIRDVLSRAKHWAPKCIPDCINTAMNDVHAIARARAAQYLAQILTDCFDDVTVDDYILELAGVIGKNINDPDREARAATRTLFLAFKRLWPQAANKLFEKFSSSIQRAIKHDQARAKLGKSKKLGFGTF
jgi:CLASP N terminal